MKTAGTICFFLGLLSMFGASFRGDSVFGPIFLMGLGILLYEIATTKSAIKQKSKLTENQVTASRQEHKGLNSDQNQNVPHESNR